MNKELGSGNKEQGLRNKKLVTRYYMNRNTEQGTWKKILYKQEHGTRNQKQYIIGTGDKKQETIDIIGTGNKEL